MLLELDSLSLDRMVGFGSDGAAVMIGSKAGVAKLLKEMVSALQCECIPHELV